jgi:putative endonuclease
MEFHVYVLFSPSFNRIYIGYSADVQARIKSHNELAVKGWTVKFRPWLLVHEESFLTKKEAMTREKQLKSAKGREWIRRQILKQCIVARWAHIRQLADTSSSLVPATRAGKSDIFLICPFLFPFKSLDIEWVS